MKLEIDVPEAVEILKEIKEQPEKLFNMIRVDIQEKVGHFLTKLMKTERTHFLGREQYERIQEKGINHRNGSYGRNYKLKGIRKIRVEMPRDRKQFFYEFKQKWEEISPPLKINMCTKS